MRHRFLFDDKEFFLYHIHRVFFCLITVIGPVISIAQLPCTVYDAVVRLQIKNASTSLYWQIAFPSNNVIVYQGKGNVDTIFCFPKNVCLKFKYTISSIDTVLTGIPKIKLVLNNETLFTKEIKAAEEKQHVFNCDGGINCSNPEYIIPKSSDLLWEREAEFPDKWYSFTAPKRGVYELSTVNYNSNTCDTRLYMYDRCENMAYLETQEYSYAYNDNYGSSRQSLLRAPLDGGQEYFIRIGDSAKDCVSKNVKWRIKFADKVKGCMDTSACNYNPLAEISDSNLCTSASANCSHDLAVFKKDIYSTLMVTQYKSKGKEDECELYEGCFKAIGVDRQLLNFSSLIKNVGDIDFFIGNPTARPEYFIFDPCHNHYHYNELVSVNLYNQQLKLASTGFKAGFCLIDASCEPYIVGKYNSCVNQGISPNCWDYYGPAAICNWVDITDIDTGIYYFVLTVNKTNRPDALGRYEKTLVNNTAIVKINLQKNLKGEFLLNIVDTSLNAIKGEGALIQNREFNEIENEKTIPFGKINDVEKEFLANFSQGCKYSRALDFAEDGKISVSDIVKYLGCDAHASGILVADKNPYINAAICKTSALAKNYVDTVSVVIQQYDSISNVFSLFVHCSSSMIGMQIDFPKNLIDSFWVSPQSYHSKLVPNSNSEILLMYNSASESNSSGFFVNLWLNKKSCRSKGQFEGILDRAYKEAVSVFYNSLKVFNTKKGRGSLIQFKINNNNE